MHCGHAIVPPGGDGSDGTEVSIGAFRKGDSVQLFVLYSFSLASCVH